MDEEKLPPPEKSKASPQKNPRGKLHALMTFFKNPLHTTWIVLVVLLLGTLMAPFILTPCAPYSYVAHIKLAQTEGTSDQNMLVTLPHSLDAWVEDRFNAYPADPNWLKEGHQYRQQQLLDNKSATLSVIVLGLGRNVVQTESAIDTLPPEVALAFFPGTWNLQEKLDQAIAKHSILLLMLPMEPLQYPENDPGAHTLLTGIAPNELQQRVQAHLGTLQHLSGLVNFMGARFTPSKPDMDNLFQALQGKKLFFVDAGSSPRSVALTEGKAFGIPIIKGDTLLNSDATPADFAQQLGKLEHDIHRKGHVTVYVFLNNISLNALPSWLQTLPSKRIALTPLTASETKAETQ